MNSHYLKYKKKYRNDKFILNGGMKEVEFELHGITLIAHLPDNFFCPITNEIMENPVITSDGYSYEKSSITRWFTIRHTNPISNQILLNTNLIPNHTLKSIIIDFKESIYKRKILELNRLAEQNSADAQYELGIAYSIYPPNLERSLYWLNKAAEQHHEQAQEKIIEIRGKDERDRLERERLVRERLERERLKIEKLERNRLALRERGITEKEKRTLLLRSNIDYRYIEELFNKYGLITDVVFNMLISGRSKSYNLLHDLLIEHPQLATIDNFSRIIALDPPVPLNLQNQLFEHLIKPHDPAYKPRDRELIIQDLINRYPSFLTANNRFALRQYIAQELRYINSIRDFYYDHDLDGHIEVIMKLRELGYKEGNLISIRNQLDINF
jgi:hypothetical protein